MLKMSLRSIDHTKVLLRPNIVTLRQAWTYHEAAAEALATRLEVAEPPSGFSAALLFRTLPYLSRRKTQFLRHHLQLTDAEFNHLELMSTDHSVIVNFILSHQDPANAALTVFETGFAKDTLIARSIAYGLLPLGVILLLMRLAKRSGDLKLPESIGSNELVNLWIEAGGNVDLLYPLRAVADRACLRQSKARLNVAQLPRHLRDCIKSSFNILLWQAPDYLISELLAGATASHGGSMATA